MKSLTLKTGIPLRERVRRFLYLRRLVIELKQAAEFPFPDEFCRCVWQDEQHCESCEVRYAVRGLTIRLTRRKNQELRKLEEAAIREAMHGIHEPRWPGRLP